MRKIKLFSVVLIGIFFFLNVNIMPQNGPFIKLGTSRAYGEGIDSYTKLLMHFDGSNGSNVFEDECDHIVTATGNTMISTDQSVFGGSSALFDGYSDYLSIADSDDWYFGTSDFTIDMRVFFKSFSPSNINLFSQANVAAYTPVRLDITSTGKIHLLFSSTGNSWDIDVYGTTVLSRNTWYHIALVRNSNKFTVYVNGVSEINFTSTISLYNSTYPVTISKLNGSTYFLDGYIDELRVSKDIARWTTNFLPQDYPYIDRLPINNAVSPSQNGTLFSKHNRSERGA
jgi:hypothetical protein